MITTKGRYFMLTLINEIKEALRNNCLITALNSAIILPDICAQVEFPKERSSEKRYVDWCNKYLNCSGFVPEYIVDLNTPREKWQKTRIINGNICYKLRCALLHAHNLNLSQKQNDNLPIFKLIKTTQNDTGQYSNIFWHDKNQESREIWVDIRMLAMVLCNTALDYYNITNNAEKFRIHNIEIIDFSELRQQKKFSVHPKISYNDLSENAKKLYNEICLCRTKEARNEFNEDEFQKCFSELIEADLLHFPSLPIEP